MKKRKIAILRGINVGGKRKILMNDLKSLFEYLGFEEVQTYIQSGNVIFKSTNISNTEIEEKIEKRIKDYFDFDVPVIVRSIEDLENTITKNPFYNNETDVTKLHLTFLKKLPSKENIEQIKLISHPPDTFEIINTDVFIRCEGKYHQSKLSNNFFENKLLVNATTRNWKTVLKLLELGIK